MLASISSGQDESQLDLIRQQRRRYGGHSAGRFSPSGSRGIGGAILVNQRSYQT